MGQFQKIGDEDIENRIGCTIGSLTQHHKLLQTKTLT